MSKGVQEGVELIAAVAVAYFTGDFVDAAKLVALAFATDNARRADAKAKAAYNASLRDRYTMARATTAPRQLVFGRCRVSGPVFFVSSYGSNREHLVMCVALAAHELDAIETVYFDDKPITIDGSGNVTGIQENEVFSISTATATVTLQGKPKGGFVTATATYGETVVSLSVTSVSGSTVSVSGATAGVVGRLDLYYQPDPDPYGPVTTAQYTDSFTIATGSDTFTLSHTPNAGTVVAATQSTSSDPPNSVPVTVGSVSANHVTISGASAQVGKTVNIHYQVSSGTSRARVRKYLGTATQAADAGMISELPGVWTSAHKASGVAYLVVELDYSDDAFSTGIPNVSAVVRGMKCYDPRTGTTAWTENPAIQARALATHPLGGNLPASAIDDASVIQAANVCDQVVTYTLGTTDYVRKLYASGYQHAADRKPMDGLHDLCEAMGGSWAFANGQLRLNAGAYRVPSFYLDETWLSGDAPIQVQGAIPRAQLINTITASIADESQSYRVVPMPRMSPSAYTTQDGATLAQDLQFGAVTFAGQAQYIAACRLRQMRQGLMVTLRCNLKAWPVERFDVGAITLDRFGWNEKEFEVIEWAWNPDGSVTLAMRETSSLIFDMDAGFPDVDIAPNTSLLGPWGLPQIQGLNAVSDSTTLFLRPDGTVVPRIEVTWTAVTDPRILQGGWIEIRYWDASDPSTRYQVHRALPDASIAYLDGVTASQTYVITARTVSTVTVGDWCPQISLQAATKETTPWFYEAAYVSTRSWSSSE